ncbi:type IX secretion system membrane protein PorP/SprF [Flavobacterium humidisoli]|uniref:Type IX secretion system membrane protein PorP/SprF n=1 Tax=Flavobacterium humidisoli TaxID=2937442 RepID=A0ABY4LXS5_9FLAO|nr:type IX secretion system membrane protein PorP/SprF [Flavobacterium humidisoli]UPZ17900.1 type IX secretion system membrane protein PorP/SprF [Flavobacterium humidisoli]
MIYSRILFYLALFASLSCFSQEGIAVYSDYLSDNYYLIHPSMAGAAKCDKIRLTIRNQWSGEKDAPALQTLSYNARFNERSAGGIIVYNDRNGYHSQKGAKLTYAHHIMFSRDEVALNQLSFGINASMVQSHLDETTFLESGIADPIIFGNIQNASYFNFDLGASYNFLDMYAHFTVKNALDTKRNLYTDFESGNLRKYILSGGYISGDLDRILWEPSIMFQFIERTKEKTIDLNLKAYRNFSEGMVWGGLSYRRGLDGSKAAENVSKQRLQYITPLIGFNYKKFMFAYTYSAVAGNIKFDNGAYHQITLGINLSCRKERYDCRCPAVN